MSRIKRFCILGLLSLGIAFFRPDFSRAEAVSLQNATATYSQTIFTGNPVAEAIDGIIANDNGWAIHRGTEAEVNSGAGFDSSVISETAVFETVNDLGFAGSTDLTFTLTQGFNNPQHNVGRFRLSLTTDSRSTFADGLATSGDVTANWIVLHPLTVADANGATLTVLGDDSILASGTNPASSIYTITASTTLLGVTGFRLEVLEDPSLPKLGPGRFPQHGNFVLTEFAVTAVPNRRISFSSPLLPWAWSAAAVGGERQDSEQEI